MYACVYVYTCVGVYVYICEHLLLFQLCIIIFIPKATGHSSIEDHQSAFEDLTEVRGLLPLDHPHLPGKQQMGKLQTYNTQ